MAVLQSESDEAIETAVSYPIVVDLDHTFLKVDTLYELFATGLFTRPLATLLSLLALRDGIAAFKSRLAGIVQLDASVLPVRGELLSFLKKQAESGRDIHLATAADRSIAGGVAQHYPIFKSVQATENFENLKGAAKARKLAGMFPDGFVYAGDSFADLPVWRAASAAIVERTTFDPSSSAASIDQAVSASTLSAAGGRPAAARMRACSRRIARSFAIVTNWSASAVSATSMAASATLSATPPSSSVRKSVTVAAAA